MNERELTNLAEGNGYRIQVTGRDHAWVLDEAVAKGGTNAGPSPVESFLGALLSCLTMSFQFSARRKNVAVERIEGWIAANETKYIERIAIELQVWSPAAEDEVRALLPFAERGCFVKNTLKPEIELSIELVVNPGESA
ncbi:MAG: OsmC family protein [Dehalococcoidia bacterium]